MLDELFETFDASGNAAGVAPRSRVHREGLWHRAASVFLFRSDGRLVVQRRQWNKDVCPGAWDLSVAEHLKPGETYEQGAIRGLREELGVEQVVLERLGSVTRARLDLVERGLKDYELQQSFRGVFDGELSPDSGEVFEVATLDLAALCVGFTTRPDDYTPWFRSSAIRLGLCSKPSSGSVPTAKPVA
jgi:isopentenyl-diphosphate Delta-isomerase